MSSALAALPTIGETIGEGRFELLAKLGEGGMSLVFRARDHDLGRDVALKLLQPRYVGRPEREQRLINEAEYLRRLCGHPNVVEYVAEGRLDDREGWPWLTTEILEGTVLSWLLVQRKPTPSEVVHVARSVAEALRACHAAGVVHRDPTPGNVFLLSDAAQTIKLFDFSHAGDLAGPKVAAGTHGRLTGIHDVPGTLGYMGPEQVSTAPADVKMDVFGFGVLLFEIVTRRNPYQHITEREAFIEAQRAGTLEAPRLHAWAYGVPDDLAELVHDCTARDPAQRPAMAEVLRRLDALELVDVAPPEPAPEVAEPTESIDARAVIELRTKLPLVTPAPAPAPVVDETAVELPFARPPELRGPASVLELHEPSPSPAEPEPDTVPPSPSKRWRAVVVLAVLLAGAALLWTQRPSTSPGEPSSAAEPEPKAPSESKAPPEATPVPLEPSPSPSPEAEAPSPSVEPIEPTPSKPRPKPAPDPACAGVEDEARAAEKTRDWTALANLTAKPKCFASKREFTQLRVRATYQLGRWADCWKAGRTTSDASIRALVDTCKENLGTP